MKPQDFNEIKSSLSLILGHITLREIRNSVKDLEETLSKIDGDDFEFYTTIEDTMIIFSIFTKCEEGDRYIQIIIRQKKENEVAILFQCNFEKESEKNTLLSHFSKFLKGYFYEETK